MLREFYRGKRVLLTGDTGFKGSWLALWLQSLGAEVLGFSLPPEERPSHFELLNLDRRIKHIDGDIRYPAALQEAFSGFLPELVFHLAAQPLVRRSYREPKLTFDTNIGGSVNLLEAARRTGSVKSLVFVTSDKCYRNQEWLWGYRENDELGGHDPYSASKAAAELVFSSYLSSFEKELPGMASVRAGNVIGGGDWSQDRIVPDCIKALSNDRPILVRNPVSVRPWQHVLEPLGGYLLLALELFRAPERFRGAWNFGPEGESTVPVLELARKIVKHWGSGEIELCPDANAPHETGLLLLNCDKAKRELGWRSRWNADRTIEETVRWYRGFEDGESMVEMSLQQLRSYQEEARL